MLKKGKKYFKKYCGVKIARFLKYVWPLFNIIHEKVKHK